MSYSFNAQPQVVKGKSKYRADNGNEEIENKTPWDLEQEYVKREEDRIKIENMQRQLLNFKKSNKNKKMSPFDIKPTPNPRIPINLSFFLTDQDNRKPKVKNVVAQTDNFNQKVVLETAVAEAEYVPKKTGIDAFTQVENDELFNFDNEVTPIVDVIISKTLEQSLLEIEEEEEIEKMRLFKRDYVRRKVKKNDDDWKEIIEAEMDKVDEKERMLAELSYVQIRKEQLGVKLISHQMATSYLNGLLGKSLENLYIRGKYQEDEETTLLENFTEWMLGEVMLNLEEDIQISSQVKKIYPNTVSDLKKMRQPADILNGKHNRKYTRIDEYKNSFEKDFWFYWINEVDNCPLFFTVFHEMILDGSITQYDTDMCTRLGELNDRYEGGQLNAEEFDEAKKNDFPDQGRTCFRMGLNGWENLAFGMANNCFNQTMKTDRIFKTGCLAISGSGKILGDADYFTNKNCLDKALRVREAPWFKDALYNDELLCKVNLKKCEAANVKYLYFYVYCEDIDGKLPQMIDLLEKSHYHIFNKDTGVNFHRVSSVGKLHNTLYTYAPEVKEQADDEPTIQQNNFFMGCYLVHLKESGNWTIESLKAQAILRENIESFKTRIAKQLNAYSFYGDHQSSIEAWARMLAESKKAAENINSGARGKGDSDDEADDDEGEADKKAEDTKAKDGKKEGEKADGDADKDDVPILSAKGHLNRLIGPIKVNLKTSTAEQVNELLNTHIQKNEKKLFEYFTAGFEISCKYNLLEDVGRQMKNVHDWRQLVIKKLEPLPQVTENDDGENLEGDEEVKEDDD